MAEKACSICKTSKPLEVFENDKRRPDGKGPRCKPCIKSKSALKKTCGEILEIRKIAKNKEKCVSGFPMKTECKPIKPKKEEPHVKATNECDCGHLLGSHNIVQNPDGPGYIAPCWKGTGKDRCPCRNYSHNGQQYGEILK